MLSYAETFLLTCLSVVLTFFGTIKGIAKHYVPKELYIEHVNSCTKHRKDKTMAEEKAIKIQEEIVLKRDNEVKEQLQIVLAQQNVQFRMLRGVVLHMKDLPADEKERILNIN